ncbi:Hypothetical predicted protein [Mytilus galloprovincialis]|uniref:Uncharacterized protein n=1 Tax=Mytilus galloprovincialis TaxID=29158 RepID=A0A8B6E3H6_MYTGA|nr:Hypothetical predicted protein [Mytilus galloprovincialis]
MSVVGVPQELQKLKWFEANAPEHPAAPEVEDEEAEVPNREVEPSATEHTRTLSKGLFHFEVMSLIP